MTRFVTRMQKVLWLVDFLFSKKFKQEYKNQYSGRCCVLANGPSLNDAFTKYDQGELEITNDSIVMNLAALDKHFWTIKPKHMCFSDSMFYQDYEPRKEAIREQFDMLNTKVDWNLNLYLCFLPWEIEAFKKYARLTNPKLHIIPMNRRSCNEWPSKYWSRLLSSGYYMPEVGTVSNVAIHIALLCGYKEIELYGMDQIWFLNFYMADDNNLNVRIQHFYEKEETNSLKPIQNQSIRYCMGVLYRQFRGHDMHALWAKEIGAHIVNCTPESMIDSFDRIGRDGKLHKAVEGKL